MERVLIHIHGIVQGVGFRPFIHKLVLHYALRGTIKNTSSGVELELEGEREELERFIADLPEKVTKKSCKRLNFLPKSGIVTLAWNADLQENTSCSPRRRRLYC